MLCVKITEIGTVDDPAAATQKNEERFFPPHVFPPHELQITKLHYVVK
jgi:hypothetical protein